MDQLLTLRQVADYLSVNSKTVRRLVACRAIPCVRVGALLRFRQATLVRFVEARKG